MARQVRFHRTGGPEVLCVEDHALAALAPGDVRIDVHAIGLNRVEVMERCGAFGDPPFPATLGYEAAGIIRMTGRGVSNFAVGDRVAILPGVAPPGYGTYGDVIDYPAAMLIALPKELSFEQAAASWMQYLTAYGLVQAADIREGDYVVITAASSSVGLAATELANAAGAISIAVTRGSEKVEALRDHGAAHVVATDAADIVEAVRDITGGRRARIVFDAVAGPGLLRLIEATATLGIVLVYGMLGGMPDATAIAGLMERNITLRGWSMGMLTADPALRRAATGYIGARLRDGRFSPVVDSRFPFDRVADAHARMESNAQFGKIIVTTR